MEFYIIILLTVFNILITIYIFKLKKLIEYNYNEKLEKYRNGLNKEFEDYKKYKERNFKVYSELINLTRPFLQDPSLSYVEARDMAEKFIIKYNNEILPFASDELVASVNRFLYSSVTKVAEKNELTESLKEMINAIRVEQWLSIIEDIKIHSLDIKELEERYENLKAK